MIPPTETNKAPVPDPKEIEIYGLWDKKFRIILLQTFSELQEYTEKQSRNRKTMCEQNKFNKGNYRNH